MEDSDLLPRAGHRYHCLPERFFESKILPYPHGLIYSEISLGRHSVRHYLQFCTAKLELYSGSIFWEEPRYHGHSASTPRTIQNYGGHEQNNSAPNSAGPAWETIELGKPISLTLQMVHNDQSRNAFLPKLRLLSFKQDIEARTYVRVPGLNPQRRKPHTYCSWIMGPCPTSHAWHEFSDTGPEQVLVGGFITALVGSI
jgi:hypothetical protein